MKIPRASLRLLLALPLPSLAQDAPPPPPPAENLQAPQASAPSGISETTAALPSAAELAQGLTMGLATSMFYDSNTNPGIGGAEGQGDTIFTVSPSIAYRNRSSIWTLGANAALNHSTYFDQSDLGGLGYTAGMDFGYNGRPLTVRGSFSSALVNGVNQYYGGYTETLSFSTSLAASYRWSAKTSLDARFGYNASEPDQDGAAGGAGNFGGSENMTFDLSAMWRATPLTRIGPGIAWSHSSGDLQPDRDTVGPIVRVNYNLSRKVALDGTFGVQFADYGAAGDADPTFTTSLGVNYRASALWGMNLTVYQGTTADGAAVGTYRETTAIRLNHIRRIRRAALVLGVGYETNDVVNAGGPAGAAGGAGDYLTFNAILGMPIIGKRVQAATFFTWRDGSGGNAASIDGYQVGVSLSTSF